MILFFLQAKTWNAWTDAENAAIRKAFHAHFLQQKYPQHHDVLLAVKHFPILGKRGVDKIKHKVKNDIRKTKKGNI